MRIFFPASSNWQSEGLFGQSFSTVLSLQALKGLPCLGSFSVVQYIRHIEGPPGWGPTLDLCVSHLKEHLGWGTALQCSSSGI